MNTGMDALADLPGPEDFDALLAREELAAGGPASCSPSR